MSNKQPGLSASRTRQRQKLIDACISALHLHGPSRTTIDKVVSIADMSPGIVNFYFETKAALLLSALESLAVEFEERVLVPVADARARPVEALELLIALYLDADIASPRKISVWYSFWGEASSRREYHAICGKRDVAFADLVRDLIERLIAQSASAHLDADAVALGLIGALEIMWQDIAFQNEADIDRQSARRRCHAYLRSVFPRQFGVVGSAVVPPPPPTPFAISPYADKALFEIERRFLFHGRWQWVAHGADLAAAGDYVAATLAGEPVLAVRNSYPSVRIFRNACTRRPHAVAAAPAGHAGGIIVCPADGWRYALDGSAADAGRDGLAELPVHAEGALLFTLVMPGAGDAPAPAIEGQAFLDRLVPCGPWQQRACLADWKLVAEHWADVYFAADNNDRTAGLAAAGAELTERREGLVWRLALDGEGIGWSGVRYAGLLGAGAERWWLRQLLWPNLFIETRPDGATIRQLLPISEGRCEIRSRHYRVPEGGREARALSALARRLIRTWEIQDDVVVASTQCGLAAPSQRAGAALELPRSPLWRWLRDRV